MLQDMQPCRQTCVQAHRKNVGRPILQGMPAMEVRPTGQAQGEQSLPMWHTGYRVEDMSQGCVSMRCWQLPASVHQPPPWKRITQRLAPLPLPGRK